MSKLNELVAELCPDGVEYKALGDLEDEGLIKLGRGKIISKKAIAATPGDYPIYSSAATNGGLFGKYGKWMFNDTRITWSVDGGGKFFYRQGGRRYSVTNVCGWMQVASEEIDAKYLYYTLSNEWSKKVFDYVHKAYPSVIREEYVLPLPPTEIQREIVRILDSFQELDDALTAEIKAREKQLDSLRFGLTRDSRFGVEQLKPLSKVASFAGGHTPSKANPENYADGQEGISWVTSKDVKAERLGISQITLTEKGAEELRLYPVGTIVMVTRSGILRRYLPIASLSVESTVNQDIRCICPDATMVDDFVFEVLKARADYMLRTFFNLGGTVDSINFNQVKAMLIPVPSIEEQRRIVDAIQPLERLIEELIAERDARRKQFEYYRGKLLSFPERDV